VLYPKNCVILFDQKSQHWLNFTQPLKIIRAEATFTVLEALCAVENEVALGHWAAGFVSYDAGPAFDPALVVFGDTSGLPLLWFGIYAAPQPVAAPPQAGEGAPIPWQASISEAEYNTRFAQIKAHIAAGDTYQVNYTFRLRAPFKGDPWELFARAAHAQGSGYPAYVDTGDWVICSASPELFFTLDGEKLVSKPMKGTAPRGLRLADDLIRAEALQRSEKNRAENVMIVDMVRNDLGRIARLGSVHVPRLFDVEKYRTIWQMTSTVACETSASLTDIFTALFPAASITGAPKTRTLQIIRELESSPRRIYTGTLGYIAPGRQAQFNVAIRTVLLDQRSGVAEYGLGGGIVWDSEPRDELQEAYTKAKILTQPPPRFSLLETLLWTPANGFNLLAAHLARLAESAAYFDFPLALENIRQKLADLAETLPPTPQRIRLLLDAEGVSSVEAAALNPLPAPYHVRLAEQPVASKNPFLYHKTTHRKVYQEAAIPGFDDVLLWNERGEVTESTIANLVIQKNGQWLTPPVECGLLPGTARAQMLADGKIREAVIHMEDLLQCDQLFLLNSVRGRWAIDFIHSPGTSG
jgi:para-aminobenzoate synthetase / 4-amino-4-deoxychorismate lyase